MVKLVSSVFCQLLNTKKVFKNEREPEFCGIQPLQHFLAPDAKRNSHYNDVTKGFHYLSNRGFVRHDSSTVKYMK